MRTARRTRLALVAATAVGLPLLVVATAPTASAACATRTTRSISGVVYGVDNMDVNVSLGFDVESTSGVIIDATPGVSTYGCRKTGGYSVKVQEKNHYVKYNGQPKGSKMYDANGVYKGVTTRTWSLTNLPSNAKYVWIEAYARGYNGSPCITCMGPANTTKYGYSMRRRVPVGATNVMVRLPVNCGYPGGGNGAITGTVKTSTGALVKPDKVYAWSNATDSNYKVLGWGSAGTPGTGTYKINALASNQSYTVWLYRGSTLLRKYNVPVSACKTTTLNWVV